MTWTADVVNSLAAVAQAAEVGAAGADGDVVLDGFERSIQLDDFSCGAQVTHAILRYFGRARSISRTTDLLGTDDDGTSWAAMRRLFLARGLSARAKHEARKRDIKAAIDRGAPVVVSVDDEEHWACVFGYGKHHVYLADPSLPRSLRVLVPWSTFMRRWDRWAGVVSNRRRRSAHLAREQRGLFLAYRSQSGATLNCSSHWCLASSSEPSIAARCVGNTT